jgi:hypothetical protein
MWIFTTKGFFSIVKYDRDARNFVVRSRVEGDIEAMWPAARVHRWPERDYLFRALIPKWEVAEAIDLAVQAIDYQNFKDAVIDKRRSYDYGLVWLAMADMQAALEPVQPKPKTP